MTSSHSTFDLDSEVIGFTLIAFIECSRKDEIEPILKRHNLTTVDPQKWYPIKTWLNVLSDISEKGEAMFDFVSIGMRMAEDIPYPPEVLELPFEAIMQTSNEDYQSNHRGDAGEIISKLVGDRHLTLTYRTPYPDDLRLWSSVRPGAAISASWIRFRSAV